MSGSQFWIGILIVIPVLLYIYIKHNDSALTRLPPEALALSPHRCTAQDVHIRARNLAETPISTLEYLPPKTGRYYIVVGGVIIFFFIRSYCTHLHIVVWVRRRLDSRPSTPTWRRPTQD